MMFRWQRIGPWRLGTACVVGATVLAGCGSAGNAGTASPSATSTPAAPYRIVLVVGQNNDPFYVTMAKGATAEAQKLGVNFSWEGPPEFDPSQQIPILSAVLSAKPNFLIAVPTDANALIAPLQQFDSAGIPVMTADTDVANSGFSVRLGNITSNNTLGGQLAAQQLAAAVKDKGKVFLLCDPPGITTDTDRQNGFETEIKKYPGITFVGVQDYNGSDATDATRVMQAELARVPDLAGVVTCDGAAGLGAATALTTAGLAGKVKLVSFDSQPNEVTGLKQGTFTALMIQRSYDIGATAVEDAYYYLKDHRKIPAETMVPYVVGTTSNIDSPSIQKYYYVG